MGDLGHHLTLRESFDLAREIDPQELEAIERAGMLEPQMGYSAPSPYGQPRVGRTRQGLGIP